MTHPARYCPSKAQKPIRGSLLNRSHPLARGLEFFVKPGNYEDWDYVGQQRGTGAGGATLTGVTPKGSALETHNTSTDFWYWTNKIYHNVINATTIMVLLEADSYDADGCPIGIPHAAGTWNDPWYALSIKWATNDAAYFMFDSGGLQSALSDNSYFRTGQVDMYVVTRIGTATIFYRNGVHFSTEVATSAGNYDWDNQCPIVVMTKSHTNPSQGVNGRLIAAGIWSRVLLPAEVQQLHREPYCMF